MAFCTNVSLISNTWWKSNTQNYVSFPDINIIKVIFVQLGTYKILGYYLVMQMSVWETWCNIVVLFILKYL